MGKGRWGIYLVDGCVYVCRSTGVWMGAGEFGRIWARVVIGGWVWMGDTDWARMEDISS